MKWNNARPTYCALTAEQQKAYLINCFEASQLEVSLFTTLCNNWSEKIEFLPFMQRFKANPTEVRQVLIPLIRKLENCGIATLQMEYRESGAALPRAIILTEQYHPYLLQTILEEHYKRLLVNPTLTFFTLRDAHFSPTQLQRIVTDSDFPEILHILKDAVHERVKIMRLDMQYDSIIVSTTAVPNFYRATLQIIAHYLETQKLQKELAQSIPKFNPSTAVADVVHNNHTVVHTVSNFLLLHYKRIIAHYPPTEKHLHNALTVAFQISKLEIELGIHTEIKEKRFEDDFNAIADKIHRSPNIAISMNEYLQILEEYRRSWGASFHRNSNRLREQAEASPIIFANEVVLHKERLKEYMHAYLPKITLKLNTAYRDDIITHMKKGDLMLINKYQQIQNLQSDLLIQLKLIAPTFSSFLDKPSLLKRVVEFADEHTHGQETAGEAQYGSAFDMRKLFALFTIDPVLLFISAYRRLSIIKKISLRLSVDFYDILERFKHMSEQIYTLMDENGDTDAHTTQRAPHDQNHTDEYQSQENTHDTKISFATLQKEFLEKQKLNKIPIDRRGSFAQFWHRVRKLLFDK